MKRSSKIILLTTALITASGVAAAGYRYNCDGQGPYGYGPARMQGMQEMRGMRGQFGPGRGMRGGGPGRGAIYQLDNLTDEQKSQITNLRQKQHEQMAAQREQRWQQRAEMKKQVDAILTEEQRQQLRQLRPWH